ncbi:MAG: ATP-binding protein, partial [bacterium]|nr:ATP-binding protein [bacterium]
RMRRFHSYGPVDCEEHFCVTREELVNQSIEQLIGNPEKGGHYFTIWAPRQTGKTWLMRQALKEIPQRCQEQFAVFHFSLGTLRGMAKTPSAADEEVTLPARFRRLLERVLPTHPDVPDWEGFCELFSKDRGLWDRPLILLIDEFDTIPSWLISLVVAQFRELYLNRETNWLHGLALIGVRAVLGVDSHSGSPFNIQKSLHVPNLTRAEVLDLYQQYQDESGQQIEPNVVSEIFRVTNGQPGLVSWFGELLTTKYSPDPTHTLGIETWKTVWRKALFREPNNTLINLISKAREPEYQPFLLELFTHANIPFSFHKPLHNYMYLHGIVDAEAIATTKGEEEICRFSCPFVQQCLYQALGDELVEEHTQILALNPLDELTEVFAGDGLNLPALLQRYTDYLKRLKANGLNPWKDQPRRKT